MHAFFWGRGVPVRSGPLCARCSRPAAGICAAGGGSPHGGEVWGASLDEALRHPVLCNAGGVRLRAHRASVRAGPRRRRGLAGERRGMVVGCHSTLGPCGVLCRGWAHPGPCSCPRRDEEGGAVWGRLEPLGRMAPDSLAALSALVHIQALGLQRAGGGAVVSLRRSLDAIVARREAALVKFVQQARASSTVSMVARRHRAGGYPTAGPKGPFPERVCESVSGVLSRERSCRRLVPCHGGVLRNAVLHRLCGVTSAPPVKQRDGIIGKFLLDASQMRSPICANQRSGLAVLIE